MKIGFFAAGTGATTEPGTLRAAAMADEVALLLRGGRTAKPRSSLRWNRWRATSSNPLTGCEAREPGKTGPVCHWT
jgi:hypothetical protein